MILSADIWMSVKAPVEHKQKTIQESRLLFLIKT